MGHSTVIVIVASFLAASGLWSTLAVSGDSSHVEDMKREQAVLSLKHGLVPPSVDPCTHIPGRNSKICTSRVDVAATTLPDFGRDRDSQTRKQADDLRTELQKGPVPPSAASPCTNVPGHGYLTCG